MSDCFFCAFECMFINYHGIRAKLNSNFLKAILKIFKAVSWSDFWGWIFIRSI